MTDDVISLADRRDQLAERYRDVDCEILDIARLVDCAVQIHFWECIEERAVSDYGPTCDLILRELQRRTSELAGRLWDRPRGNGPAA